MEYELDSMFEFDSLGAYFEVHVDGIEGECFTYSVYTAGVPADEKADEVRKSVEGFFESDGGGYPGYIDVTREENKILIYLDLGGAEDCDRSIYGVVRALMDMKDISRVIVNEDE